MDFRDDFKACHGIYVGIPRAIHEAMKLILNAIIYS